MARALNESRGWTQESLHFAGPKAQALDKFSTWKMAHQARRANGALEAITFAELGEHYLKRATSDGRSAGWVMHQRQHLNGPMAKFFGSTTRIKRIPRSAIEGYLSMLTKSVKRTTANKHRACLRRMFQFAVEQGYLTSSPAAEVRRLKHDGLVHGRFLTPDEFKRLREVAESQRAAQALVPTAHAFDALPEYLDLAVSLATRPTETLMLRFADIDWLNRFSAIRKTKSGKDRVLPLSNTALTALLMMKERSIRRASSSFIALTAAPGRTCARPSTLPSTWPPCGTPTRSIASRGTPCGTPRCHGWRSRASRCRRSRGSRDTARRTSPRRTTRTCSQITSRTLRA